ncbi:membrane-associated phospholipid phosphatase [Leifsonia sp. EB41]|uniref:phosphatase PAP2 family protein n=1 Tax=Leifsonia sp. EB41 TaxID=3156260 RepID=UPI003514B6DF
MTATTPRRALGGDEQGPQRPVEPPRPVVPPRSTAAPSATARAIVVPLIVILLVVLAGLAIVASPAITAWDLGVIRAVEGARTPFLDAVTLADDVLFSPVAALAIVGLVSAATWIARRRLGPALAFAALALLPWLGSTVVKDVVQRPRPLSAELPHHVLTDTGFSFPSGHTSFAVALALALLIVFGQGRLRGPLIAFAVVAPLLTAFSRVYLGVHNPTDVLASLVYATAAVLLVLGVLRLIAPPLERFPLIGPGLDPAHGREPRRPR